MPHTPIQLTAYTAISALGLGLASMREALLQEKSGLRLCDFDHCQLNTYIGRIPTLESYVLPKQYVNMHSRNNLIAFLALQQDDFFEKVERAKIKYGKNKIGLVFATSTSGFLEFENFFRDERESIQEKPFHFKNKVDFYSTAQFIASYLEIEGLSFTISTACSSSAKTFISAARLLQQGICDAVVVAGVDSLCLNTLYGFASLELLARDQCRPSDVNRQGLNIGEAGAFILLERGQTSEAIQLLGYGESSDAYHMSSPHPEGKGGQMAMQEALTRASLKPEEIDYINLHGTATPSNDSAEGFAVAALFSDLVPCSSTKAWTGHTLGTAGALEAIISCLCMEMEFIPKSLNTVNVDPAIPCQIALKSQRKKIKRVLSNSFGFGGSNCSLIFGSAL